jgi:hypothetical protein
LALRSWSFTYFFINHRRREVVFFACSGFPSGIALDTIDTDAVPAAHGMSGANTNASPGGHVCKPSKLSDLLLASQDYEDGTWDMEMEDDDDE